jgi:hypothetical protein
LEFSKVMGLIECEVGAVDKSGCDTCITFCIVDGGGGGGGDDDDDL